MRVSTEVDILILGGGLAGLAAAETLRRRGVGDFLVVEAEPTVGGLARTSRRSGLAIDILPHVFFSRDPVMDAWFEELVPDHTTTKSRLGVRVAGRYLDYPFQLHVHALPHALKVACLEDYFAALRQSGQAPGRPGPGVSFEQFLLGAFGRSMVDVFFRPYNEKQWQTPLAELDTDWVARKIDGVNDRDMAYSFLGYPSGSSRQRFGPHARFRYPRQGGIQALPEALAARVGTNRVRLGTTVTRVRPKDRVVETDQGSVRYRRLIWTIPRTLAHRLLRTSPASSAGLRATEVVAVHLVAREVSLPDYHWIYVADTDVDIYRITRVDAIQPWATGKQAVLILEVSRRPTLDRPPAESLVDPVIDTLVRLDILDGPQAVTYAEAFAAYPAYVVHDLSRRRHLARLNRRFAELGIEVAGRFGEWTFLNMDMAMRSGMEAAGRVLESA